MRPTMTWLAGFVLLGTLATGVAAQEESSEEGQPEARNHLALFVGGTAVDETVRFTLGIDYERQLSRRFGVGVLADWAFGGEGREAILAAAVFYHPWSRVRLDLAPGVQRDAEQDEVEFVLRVGADYEFEIRDGWSLSPNLNLDFFTGGVIPVFGVELGYRF